jgi:prevent-host-death family protein
MTTVGAFDAKTNFSALLERAERGEQILITRRGKPVARLMPIATARKGKVHGEAAQAARRHVAWRAVVERVTRCRS